MLSPVEENSEDPDFLQLISDIGGDIMEDAGPPSAMRDFSFTLDRGDEDVSSASLWGPLDEMLLLRSVSAETHTRRSSSGLLETAPMSLDTSSDAGDDFSTSTPPPAEGVSTSGGRRKRARPTPDDEDARLIALETESHLKKLNIDPDSREGKVERRKIQNRMSAQLHRERKRAYIESLEAKIAARDATILNMKLHIQRLEESLRAVGAVKIPSFEDSEPGHATTSESGSDAEYSSSTSWSSRRREKSDQHMGLSLFSLLFMMSFGFTLLAKPDMLSSFLSPPPAAPSYAAALVPLDAWSGQGRVLLARDPLEAGITEEDDNDRGDDNLDIISEFKEDSLQQETETIKVLKQTVKIRGFGNCSLWNHNGAVAQLYPQHDQIHSNKQHDRGSSNALVTTFSQRHHITSVPQSSLRGAASQRSGPAEQRALVPSLNPFSEERDRDKSNDFPSKILMTEGKALLDPSFVRSSEIIHRHRFGFANPSDEVIRVQSMNGAKKDQPDPGTALIAPSSVSALGSQSPHYVPRDPSVSGALGSPSAPQFVMMLPIDSVKWGTSWDDDDSANNPLTQLLKNLRSNSSDTNSPADTSSYWIEIGCSVVKAQLVKNVTLS